ncbi:hypothetical protein BC332_17208 [Capsicum chinense]|nr:hypothetical protein BC332_17208 [Capsicum chinense]
MLPSENSKELLSSDQPELEADNVADQKVNNTADEKVEAAPDKKIEAAADEKVDTAADGKGDAAVDGGIFTPTPVGKCFFVFYFLSSPTLVTPYGRRKVLYRTSLGADSYQSIPRLLIVCGHDQHQGKWVALLDRKGSGHVQVNGRTISKYSFCFLNSGDEVVLSQAENNAYIVQLLLESPSDVGTSAGKGKPLNIENQVEDALAIAGGELYFISCTTSCSAPAHSYVFVQSESVIFNLLGLVPLSQGPAFGTRGKIVLSFKDSPSAKVGVQFDKPIPRGINLGGLCEDADGFFCKIDELRLEGTGQDDLENLLVNTLFEVVIRESRNSPVILFMKDAEKTTAGNSVSYPMYKSWLEKIPDNIVIIGSHIHSDDHKEEDEALLSTWKQQLDQDAETVTVKENFNSLKTVLSRIGLECNGLETLCIKDHNFSVKSAEKVVGWALSHHLMRNTLADVDMSIQYGLELLQAKQNDTKSKKKSLKDVETDNELEKALLTDVIPSSDIGVTFDDIGALESVKDTLKELIMLPLQRPELFSKSQLTKDYMCNLSIFCSSK